MWSTNGISAYDYKSLSQSEIKYNYDWYKNNCGFYKFVYTKLNDDFRIYYQKRLKND